jgi:hypothetical protein
VSKGEEKLSGVMSWLCGVLLKGGQDGNPPAQECFISIVQSLLDTEVSLVPPPGLSPPPQASSTIPITPEIFLANALPHKVCFLL